MRGKFRLPEISNFFNLFSLTRYFVPSRARLLAYRITSRTILNNLADDVGTDEELRFAIIEKQAPKIKIAPTMREAKSTAYFRSLLPHRTLTSCFDDMIADSF